jgi:hypothetical protein
MSDTGKKPSCAVFSLPIVIIIIILIIFSTGCSEPADQNSITQIPTTVSIQPKFITGDIIAKTESSPDLYWVILNYDARTNKYERAFVTKKSDGSWSRINEKSEFADRPLVEKLYPVRVDHISSLSQISIRTETSVSAETPTEKIPLPSGETTTATSTKKIETTPLSPLPVLSVMSVSGSDKNRKRTFALRGSDFQSGSTVTLTRNGFSDVFLTLAEIRSGSEIDFEVFNIPCDNPPGKYTIVVTNPDGQSATLENALEVSDCKNGALGNICGKGIYVDNGKVKTDCGVS